jgi:hypothetical protein
MAGSGVHDVGRKLARLVDRRRPRRHDLARELLDLRLERLLLGSEVEDFMISSRHAFQH